MQAPICAPPMTAPQMTAMTVTLPWIPAVSQASVSRGEAQPSQSCKEWKDSLAMYEAVSFFVLNLRSSGKAKGIEQLIQLLLSVHKEQEKDSELTEINLNLSKPKDLRTIGRSRGQINEE